MMFMDLINYAFYIFAIIKISSLCRLKTVIQEPVVICFMC